MKACYDYYGKTKHKVKACMHEQRGFTPVCESVQSDHSLNFAPEEALELCL